MNFQRYAIVIVCLAMFAFGVSAPAKAEPDAPQVNAEVQPPCNEGEFDTALNAVQDGGGGTVAFNKCGSKIILFTSFRSIYTDVTIDGSNKIILTGGNSTRHFVVQGAGARLTLKNIVLTNGSTQNAGYGGSIYMNVDTALFTDNVTFQNNTSGSYAGSAIIAFGNSAIALNNTTVQSNTTTSYGAINTTGPLTITNSVLRGNSSEAGGGAISASGRVFIRNTTLTANNPKMIGNGDKAGIYYFGGQGTSLTIQDSTLDGHNTAIDNAGVATLSRVTLINSIYGLINKGIVVLENVTLSSNGVGIFQTAGQTTLNHVTLYNKNNGLFISGGQLYLQNTVIHADGYSSTGCSSPDVIRITSTGYNLSNDPKCWPFLSQSTDVRANFTALGALTNNGGPTLTHLPQAGSPLIDRGVCVAGINTDQRGLPRFQGLSCDIGAVEVQPPAPPPSPSPSPNPIVPRARIPIVVK